MQVRGGTWQRIDRLGGERGYANARGYAAQCGGRNRRCGPRRMVLEPACRGVDHQSEQLQRSALVISFMGAIGLLAVVNLARRGAPR
jgi:hypothetical protein